LGDGQSVQVLVEEIAKPKERVRSRLGFRLAQRSAVGERGEKTTTS
jgi:hypothetical protein